jgi:hypothetical protein
VKQKRAKSTNARGERDHGGTVRAFVGGEGGRGAGQGRTAAREAGLGFEGAGPEAGGTPKDRPQRYAADLAMMHRLVTRGVRSQGGAYRLHGLKRGYEKEYAELAAEAQGQGELL